MNTPKKQAHKKERGLFERPPGSGVWWINYYVKGKQHREKVGKWSAARDLYRKRKEDDRAGRKLPTLRNTSHIMVSDLIDDVLEYTKHHKDKRNYESKATIVRAALGELEAAVVKPQDLTAWLNRQCKTAATWNRYKAFLGLCWRVGGDNGKVETNPARKFRPRKEENARLRFLSKDKEDAEYPRVYAAIQKLFPDHLAEFIVSVHTGMRLTEQYTVEWPQVHLDRRAIELDKTKNGHKRTVHLNADAITAIESLKIPGQKMRGRVFNRATQKNFDTRSWFHPCLKEAKVTGYLWHGNRHTFCSWLAMAGASTKEIQEAAGHKTIAMAARYSHLSPAHRLSVVERIATTCTQQAQEVQHAPEHAPNENNVTVKRIN